MVRLRKTFDELLTHKLMDSLYVPLVSMFWLYSGKLVMASISKYNQNILTNGTDRETINLWVNNSSKVFLNRTIGGLYTPGSILKPIVALAALNEKIISPTKKILST